MNQINSMNHKKWYNNVDRSYSLNPMKYKI